MSANPMTKAEAQAWKERWRRINQGEIDELRASTPDQNLRQLAALMASVDALGLTEALLAEEEETRRRWCEIHRAYRARGRSTRSAARLPA
jgi:hypothetical protein